MKQQNIPIFLSSDDNYAPFLCTTMYSILENTKSFISFYVLDGGITEKSKKLINESLKNFSNYTIKYVDMALFGLDRFPNIRHYSLNTFSRYFIPEIAPDLGKVIYMDVDIIVKGDIAELYSQELGEYPLAAVLEDFYKGNYTALKEKVYPDYVGNDVYFNAGVLLLDVRKLVQNKYSQKMIDLTIKLQDKLCCADQDVLNILFENNFKILDYKYNFMPDLFPLLKEKHPEIKKVNPLLIHYVVQKPWKEVSSMSRDFNEILVKTAFQEIVKQKFGIITLVKKYKLFGWLPLLTTEEL